jgi:hypothetical protein
MEYMIILKLNNKDSSANDSEKTHVLERNGYDKLNIDYISGLIEEEIAILKDEIEKQNIKIKEINNKLMNFEKSIKKR